MNQSNFEKVQEFNTATGVTRHKEHKDDVFTEDPKLVDLRLSLITEEVAELKEAINNHDFTEVRDAIADILYVAYGMADAFGIDADRDFDLVHRSNMSKLCDTEELAQRTVAAYEKKYRDGNSPYDSPIYHEIPELRKWVVKNKSTGKVLKSIEYTPVKLD